jgi:hypothetical protein
MRGWLLPYGVWYALAAAGAVGVASGAASGDVFGAVLDGMIAVGVGVVVVRSRVRWSRSGMKAVRAEMMRLVDERAGTLLWLNRDAHVVFGADRSRVAGMLGRALLVLDEDQVRDMDGAWGGKVALTDVYYRAHPALPWVSRRVGGTTATLTGDDVDFDDPGAGKPWWRELRDDVRVIRAGLAFADATEIAGVVAQFRDAEPVSRPEEPGEAESP